jgi:cation:H+ antiporter
MKNELFLFFASGALIFLAGTALARYGDAIAERTRIGGLWIGSALLAGATSLPELVASIAAVRIAAYDLAVGNLFGSNAFNMVIFLALDLADPRGASIFAALNPVHVVSALFGTVLMSVGLAAIVFRAERRFAMIEPDSFLMVVTYVFAAWFLYMRSAGS